MHYKVLNETVVNFSEFGNCLADARVSDMELVVELDRLYNEWKEEGDFYFFLEEECEAKLENLKAAADEIAFFNIILGSDHRGVRALIGRPQPPPPPPSQPLSGGGDGGEKTGEPKTGDTKTITLPGGATMEMIYCAPGSFWMGSPNDEEGRSDDEFRHRVTLTKGFWLGKYPVAKKQWKSVMKSNPSEPKGADLPVNCVSWEDCKEFIDAINSKTDLNARFPTEAEWEYACRAGTATAYSWGNSCNGKEANCDGNYPCGTKTKGPYKGTISKVGSYKANPWGFYDMHGNVWEWCGDWYGSYSKGAVTDPKGPSSGVDRVLRGGCWSSFAVRCRSASRGSSVPGDGDFSCGFRLCCSAGPHE